MDGEIVNEPNMMLDTTVNISAVSNVSEQVNQLIKDLNKEMYCSFQSFSRCEKDPSLITITFKEDIAQVPGMWESICYFLPDFNTVDNRTATIPYGNVDKERIKHCDACYYLITKKPFYRNFSGDTSLKTEDNYVMTVFKVCVVNGKDSTNLDQLGIILVLICPSKSNCSIKRFSNCGGYRFKLVEYMKYVLEMDQHELSTWYSKLNKSDFSITHSGKYSKKCLAVVKEDHPTMIHLYYNKYMKTELEVHRVIEDLEKNLKYHYRPVEDIKL